MKPRDTLTRTTKRASNQAARELTPKPDGVHAVSDSLSERLSKRVARTLGCSRSDAERYIESGCVRVNAQVVVLPMTRVSTEAIEIAPISELKSPTNITLLLHKPADFETMGPQGRSALTLLQPETHISDDWQTQVLPKHLLKLEPGVDLERAASGLVVFSQDFRVMRKLREDGPYIEHELLVEVHGMIEPNQLRALNTPVIDASGPWPVIKASINSTTSTLTRLRITLKGEHPGLIAVLCERAQLGIIGMKRLRIGRVALGHLPQGSWRYLHPSERF